MVAVTTTTYFTNNIMIRRQITLARAIALMNHTGAIIPPEADLLEVRCPSRVLLVPCHIIFNIDRAYVPHAPLPSRRGVYLRDQGRCAYCGRHIPLAEATIDHIVPLYNHGPTAWHNLVNACRACNEKKANRTPEQAHMPLLFRPFTPKVRLRPD
jgi:5-methylcytosine-specific restriction endonuclease McrA